MHIPLRLYGVSILLDQEVVGAIHRVIELLEDASVQKWLEIQGRDGKKLTTRRLSEDLLEVGVGSGTGVAGNSLQLCAGRWSNCCGDVCGLNWIYRAEMNARQKNY